MTIHLPTLNAGLNALSATFLAFGLAFIKSKNILAHKMCMTAAFTTSTLFLISYIYYHANFG